MKTKEKKPKIQVHIEGTPKGFSNPLQIGDERTYRWAYSVKQGLFLIAQALGLEKTGPLTLTFQNCTIFWRTKREDPWKEIPPDYP